ncbi:receptor-type tyrosine-protein phosphatase eta, partial [Ictalurus furcatus]|uniref:receptor-type tyrosine-protein phosphatase eta n=1 Tax=Ictalurus furcatus TaxID=66913 RepID=UPI002350BBA8
LVNWTEPIGEKSFFKVQWSNDSVTLNSTTSDRFFNITNLNPGVNYTILISAVAADNITEGEAFGLSVYTKPETVSSLTVLNVTNSSILLNWTEAMGKISYYVIQYENFSTTINKTTEITGIDITNLAPGVQYTFKVFAVAADNKTEGNYSCISAYTKPDAASDLIVTEITTSSLLVNWTEPIGEKSFFKVQWSNDSVTLNSTTSDRFFNITNLNPGVNYTILISAVAADNITEGEAFGLSVYTKPETVSSLTVLNVTNSSILLNWTEAMGKISYYVIQYENFSTTINKTTEITGIDITNLAPGVQYTFKVFAVAADNKTEGNYSCISAYTKPDAASDLIVTEITTSSLLVNWTEPIGEKSFFKVQWSNDSVTLNSTTSDRFFNITNLNPGVNYTILISAVAADNITEGEAFGLSVYTKPETVTILTVLNVTNSSILLNWTEAMGKISYYVIQYENFNTTINKTTEITGIDITNLAPGVQYTFKVFAVAADNKTEGNYSCISAYTKPVLTEPDAASDLSVTEITTSSLLVNWTEPIGEKSFFKVQWSNDSITLNSTTSNRFFNITNLNPGVNYTIMISAVAADNITEGEAVGLSVYTKPETVSSLTVLNVTTSSILLNWTEAMGKISHYVIQYENFSMTINKTTEITGIDITNLTPGVQYTFKVFAVAADNKTEGNYSCISAYTNPNAVTNLTVSNKTTSSVSLTWNEPPGNRSYFTVNWIGGSVNNSSNTSNTSYTVTGLTAGVNYTFTVTAVAADGQTAGAPTQTSICTTPDVVSSLTVSNKSTSSVSLTWNAPPQSRLYFTVNWTGGSVNNSNNTSNTSYTVTGLTAGVNYTFTVTAVAADGTTGAPTQTSAFTNPNAVTNLTVSIKTTSSVSLTWNEPPGNKSNFTVNWTDGSVNNRSNTSNMSYTVTGLTAGVNYTFTVTAVAADGQTAGAPTQISAFTKPNAVTNLTVSIKTTSSVSLTWNEPSGSRLYFTVNWTDGSVNNSSNTSNTSYTVTGLTAGVNYTFTVTAVAADGQTAGAPTQTSAFTKPNAVNNLTVSTINTSSLSLTWNEPPGNRSYFTVNWTDGSVNNSSNTSNTSYTVTGLTAGVKYTFTVTAFAADGTTGTPTQTSAFTNPNAVTNLTVSSKTTSSVSLTWNEPPGNRSYFTVNWTDGSVNNSINTSNTFYTVTDLTAGVKYTFTVTAVAADSQTTGAPTQTSICTKPNTVTNLTVYNKTTSSVSLTWNEPPGNRSYFTVNWTDGSVNIGSNTSNTSYTVTGLTAGMNYTFTVTAVAADSQTAGAPNQTSAFTKPNAVTNLTVSNKTTSSVSLTWNEPPGNRSYFTVNWTGGSVNNSSNTSNTSYTVTGLTAGVNYTFTVTAVAADGQTAGAPNQTSVCTKPNAVTSLTVYNKTTSSVSLTWNEPPGNRLYFTVNWTGGSVNNSSNTSNTSYTVTGLTAGVNYTFTVTAVAADGQTAGAPNQTSAFTKPVLTEPDAASDLSVTEITPSSLLVNWTEPIGERSFFKVQWSNDSITLNSTTSNRFFNITNLNPGVSYTILISAVAADNITEGEAVGLSVYTKPDIVRNLTISVRTTSVFLDWNKPLGESSFFRVRWTNSSTTPATDFNITDLTPGTNYTFTVSAVAADNKTEGSLVGLSTCTDASPVFDIICKGPNRTSPALLNLTWTNPPGNNQGFNISLNQTPSVFILPCSPVCNHIFSENLQYFSTYSVIISTLGCGESGTWDFKCTTGITDPSVPSNPGDVAIIVSPISQTVVKLQFNTSLLHSTNGPIKAYGVLLSTDQKSNSTRNDLTMTYSDWVKKKTKTYLTVLKLNENIISRSNMITIEIGSNNVSDVISNTDYTNGPLTNQDYRIALVLFTYLEINSGLVDIQQSILSITPFASSIAHPLEPSSNTIPIILGVLLPIIVILIIAIIVLVIQKRRTTKDYSDIPINNLRTKISIPVRVEDFEAYFKKQQLDSNCGFAEQYEDLKVVGTAQTKNSALAMENKGKNRYNNVLPYDSSRVKLSIHGSPFDDYINANYISGYNSKKEYIAAQGPLPATVNEFWRMIWEKNTHSIVMLTKCYEQGRVKCEKYWPPDNKLYNNILVTTTSEIELEDWTIRDFTIKNVKTAETRNVRQFHFTAWPDHGVPETTEVLINFRHLVREHMDSFSRNAPAVVHCSAGVGRTGTLIALDHLIFQIERESIVDIYGIIHDMRMHRPLMVQTEDQYVFLNQCASDIIKSRMGTNVDLIYQNAAAFSIYENVQR